MKKFIFALTLIACSAQAEEWMETQNNAGGKILFVTSNCSEGSGKTVISTMPDGDTIHGCWYYFSDMVHVVWTDPRARGKTSAFDPKTLTYKTSEKK